MDFGQAAILVVIFLGLIAEAKALVWGDTKQRITVGLVNVVAVVTVFLVAETVWGDTQVVGGQKLGLLDWASKLLVAIVLGGGASGLWEGFTTFKNFGQNQLTDVQKQALDAGAQRLVDGMAPDTGGTHTYSPSVDPGALKFKDDATP